MCFGEHGHTFAFHEELEIGVNFLAEILNLPSNLGGVTQVGQL